MKTVFFVTAMFFNGELQSEHRVEVGPATPANIDLCDDMAAEWSVNAGRNAPVRYSCEVE